MNRLRDDVAWEYLDDGGVLFCQLAEGAYWQLGPPAGPLLQSLLSLDGDALLAAVSTALAVEPSEATAALEAFRETLIVLALLEVPTTQSPARPAAGVEPGRDG